MEADLRKARDIAMDIRQRWSLYQNVDDQQLRAATLLLVLADEIERLRPELKEDYEDL